jgi:hypothetical protein
MFLCDINSLFVDSYLEAVEMIDMFLQTDEMAFSSANFLDAKHVS